VWNSKSAVIKEVGLEELELQDVDKMGPPPPPHSVFSQPPAEPMADFIYNSDGIAVGTKSAVPVIDFSEVCTLPIAGDVKVEVCYKTGRHEERLFSFWFNAALLTRHKFVLRKWQLDGPNKDRKHKKFSAHFRVEMSFREGPPPPALAAPVVTAKSGIFHRRTSSSDKYTDRTQVVSEKL